MSFELDTLGCCRLENSSIRSLEELTVVLSVIFNTSLPCEDLHLIQYRVYKADGWSDYKKSKPKEQTSFGDFE